MLNKLRERLEEKGLPLAEDLAVVCVQEVSAAIREELQQLPFVGSNLAGIVRGAEIKLLEGIDTWDGVDDPNY